MQLSQSADTVSPVSYEQYKADLAKRTTGNNEMGQQQFLNLLITQMKNQDPLSPMENAEFTQQTTSFSQLEQMIAMNKSLESMIKAQQEPVIDGSTLLSSSAMIGKIVEYDTNSILVSDNEVPKISFYSKEKATDVKVNIYDTQGKLQGMVNIPTVNKGANSVDIKDDVSLANGSYVFEVVGTGADGKTLEVGTYGSGEVKGIQVQGGKMYFDMGNGLVAADTIYSVKDKVASTDSKE